MLHRKVGFQVFKPKYFYQSKERLDSNLSFSSLVTSLTTLLEQLVLRPYLATLIVISSSGDWQDMNPDLGTLMVCSSDAGTGSIKRILKRYYRCNLAMTKMVLQEIAK